MQLRSYQSEASRSIWTYLQKEKGKNPLVAMATGSGKSLVIADVCRTAIQQYQGRCIVLAHRKELLEQNASKIKALLPDIDVGIYSAGLGKKDIDQDVICAGIQSVYKSAHLLGRRHIVIVDECHLIPKDGDGMYRQFLSDLIEINGKTRVIGLTATPYRTGEGHLCDGDGIFDDVVYETDIVQLIADNYLAPMVNRQSETKYDTSSLHIRGGEFIESELQALFSDYSKIEAATSEILTKTADRKSCIVFCSGVNHAELVAEILGAEVITGSTPAAERQEIIDKFRSGEIKYLCNCDVLTTGFDATCIDAVVILRSTMSAGLFVQMVGRGMRLHEGKENCLLLDFGQNLFRHGPINAIDYGQAREIRGAGDPPVKICPACKEQVFASARVCWCGHEFPPRELKHGIYADGNSEVIASPRDCIVNDWVFDRHKKQGSPDSLRVTYYLGGNLDKVTEWVCFMHEGFARDKARKWWSLHTNDKIDDVYDFYLDEHGHGDIIDCLQFWKSCGHLSRPQSITVRKDGKYDRILKRKIVKQDVVPF